MNIEIKENKITLTKVLAKGETYKISKSKKFESISFYKKPQLVLGISSRTADNHDILMVDYDNVRKEVVLEDYKYIQKKFKLPQAYLFTTKERYDEDDFVGSYHVICLLKMMPTKIHTILSQVHCDIAYVTMPLRSKHRSWVLRISVKRRKERPKFLELIGDPKGGKFDLNGSISFAHTSFLEKAYPGLPRPAYHPTKMDKLTKVYVQEYECS